MKVLDPFNIPFSGLNLIEASAGTGKTYNIASLYVRAIVEQGRSVDQILVVTYTKAATKELRERLLGRLRYALQALEGRLFEDDEFLQQLPDHIDDIPTAIQNLKQAIKCFDEASVFTIHGFCQHVLQSRAFESGTLFEADLIEDDDEVFGQMIDDYWRRWVAEATNQPNVQSLLKYLLEKGVNPDALKAELTSDVEKPYLKLLPQSALSLADFKKRVQHLFPIYKQMQSAWEGQQQTIEKLLLSDQMSGRYYRKGWLDGWLSQMDDWLHQRVPPVTLAAKMDKFRQTCINRCTTNKSTKPAPEHPFFKAADRYAEAAERVQNFDVYFKMRLFCHLRMHAEAEKEKLQVFSYDDLLIKLKEALGDETYGGRLRLILRKTYPVAMVDEFQDTDPIQYQIFRSIYGSGQPAGETALFMIGDPKQSIYSFRGADIFTYLKARRDTPEQNIYGLNRNFRSVPKLIKAVNVLFNRQVHPFILPNISYHSVEAGRQAYDELIINNDPAKPVKIRDLSDEQEKNHPNKGEAENDAAEDTARQIRQLLNQAAQDRAVIGENNVKARDIAVIVRTHDQAEMISEALKRHHLKSVRYSQTSVFKSEEAQQVLQVLEAVAAPGNEGLVMAALATEIMDYDATELMEIEQDEQQWIRILNQFSSWNEKWQQFGIVSMFGAMMQEQRVHENLIKRTHGERKITNITHLVELLQQQEQDRSAGMRSLIRWFIKKTQDDKKGADEEQLRLESDENLVKIVTMHRSKGLEYPIVFCPFLWKGPEWNDKGKTLTFHDEAAAYLDFSGKQDPQRQKKRLQSLTEAFAESLRLAYVAITRAKYQCNISWVPAQKSEFSPLGYLLLGKKQVFDILKDKLSESGKYNAAETKLFSEAWETLLEHYPNLFSIHRTEAADEPKEREHTAHLPELKERSFHRSVLTKKGNAVGSFSSLVREKHEEFDADYEPYFDAFDAYDSEPVAVDVNRFINFPKGAGPGTAVHHIFENIDFNNDGNWQEVIENELVKESIELKWTKAAANMLQTTLHKSLLPSKPNLKFNAIPSGQSIAELEFYYRSDKINLQRLLQIIRPAKSPNQSVRGFSASGFLKGFIDLIFCIDDRFYIVDYKTNYLGETLRDYEQSTLEAEMRASFYDMQYHIYLIALHRFLKCRLQHYNYEDHFGGVFYLFLRGINPNGQEGIYTDRPSRKLIEELDQYLQR